MWSSKLGLTLLLCGILTHTPLLDANGPLALALIAEEGARVMPAKKAVSLQPKVNPPAVITIGQSATLVGNLKEYQQAINNGIAAYLKKLNAAGGIRGCKIALKILNNYNNPATARENIEELRKEGIDIFLGVTGARNIKSILPIVEEKEIALFFPWGCSLDLDKNILPYLIHGQTTLKHHVQNLAAYLAGAQKHTNIGIVHSDSAFGLMNARYAQRLLETYSTQDSVVKVTNYAYNSRDAETDHIIESLNKQKPHALMLLSTGRPTTKVIKGIWNHGNYVQDFVGLESNFSVPQQFDNKTAHFRYTSAVPGLSHKEYPIVSEYLEASQTYLPGQIPSTLSLMYFINTKLLTIAIEHVLSDNKLVTKESVIAALDRIRDQDIGGFVGNFDRKTRTLYPLKISLEEGLS